jgi:ATP-dependent DNA helicase RecG
MGSIVSFLGRIIDYDEIRIKNRRQPIGILKIQDLERDSGKVIHGYIFRGNTFLRHEMKDHIENDRTIWFKGKISKTNSKLSIVQPEIHIYEDSDFKILPVYKKYSILSRSGIGQKSLITLLQEAIHFTEIKEYLPQWVLDKHKLMGIRDAYTQIHFPKAIHNVEEAKKRLKFDECIFLQLFYSTIRYNSEVLLHHQLGKQEVKLKGMGKFTHKFLDSIPFILTKGQTEAIEEIVQDVKSGLKMNRLLQGDVGCGKTIVGIVSLMMALDSGYQGVFVAPTEVLAEQHYFSLLNFLDKSQVKLLLGGQNKKNRADILNSLSSGEAKICVCTHSILNETTNFKNIGMLGNSLLY